MTKFALAALATASVTSFATAGVVGFLGDTTLEGGWDAFEDMVGVEMVEIYDGGSAFAEVSSIDVPEFGGSLDFDASHSLRQIGSGWATWSHGYTGEVFYNNGLLATGYDLNMDGVYAFDAYIEPNPFSVQTFTITAYGSDGGMDTVVRDADGSSGAAHFGFYSTGETLTRIEIEGSSDWAIGEWRVGTPTPGALALLGLAGLTARRRR